MRRNCLILSVLVAALAAGTCGRVVADAGGPGPVPGPWIRGNDTGGIIPYAPNLEGLYPQIARDYCATWGRLSQVTSVHRRYGDYISFVCIDKPWMIH